MSYWSLDVCSSDRYALLRQLIARDSIQFMIILSTHKPIFDPYYTSFWIRIPTTLQAQVIASPSPTITTQPAPTMITLSRNFKSQARRIGKSMSERVDHGGLRIINKKKKNIK